MTTKRLTQEKYVEDCAIRHSNFYNYDRVNYINGRTKVEIGCPLHGFFKQRADQHREGNRCPDCAKIRTNSMGKQTTTLATFLIDFMEAQTNRTTKYDYSKVNFKNVRTEVEIVCPLHGSFWQQPSSHLQGAGCHQCAHEARGLQRKMTSEEVISKCLANRNGECTYPDTVYLGDKLKMQINCVTHGPFWQQAGNHISGQGCPKCKQTGYNTSKPGHLYVLCSDEIVKVGITNKTPQHRIKQIAADGGPEFELVAHYYFGDGEIPRKLEKSVHNWLLSLYKQVPQKFDGSTECFLNVDLAPLLNFITPLTTPELA